MRFHGLMTLLALIPLFTGGCNLKAPTATLDAVLSQTGDTSGAGSAKVIVNFTEFSATADENRLTLTFFDLEGNSLIIALAGSSGNFPTNRSYAVDASNNTVSGLLKVVTNGQLDDVSFSGISGFVTLIGLEKNELAVLAASGEFAVNLSGGGTAVGRFSARQ